jgi:hypothetical protein
MKYAKIDASGKIQTIGEDFELPSDCIELAENEFIKIQSSPANSWFYAQGEILSEPFTDPEPTIGHIKSQKINEINAAAGYAIVAQFQSSALGTAHTYASGLIDQQNLSASVLSSIIPGNPDGWTTAYLCGDAEGAWDYRPHTAGQIQQVGGENKARIVTILVYAQSLKTAVAAADDAGTVRAISFNLSTTLGVSPHG